MESSMNQPKIRRYERVLHIALFIAVCVLLLEVALVYITHQWELKLSRSIHADLERIDAKIDHLRSEIPFLFEDSYSLKGRVVAFYSCREELPLKLFPVSDSTLADCFLAWGSSYDAVILSTSGVAQAKNEGWLPDGSMGAAAKGLLSLTSVNGIALIASVDSRTPEVFATRAAIQKRASEIASLLTREGK